jgi:hypothetical protein
MNEAKVDNDFFEILKTKDSDLAAHFENVKKKGLEDWVHLLASELGSHAGYPHLRNVERIADSIVPTDLKNSFSAAEIFLLLNAIFLHDIGKTFSPPQKPIAKCDHSECCSNRDKDDRPQCCRLQLSHFALGEDVIKNYGISLGLPDERISQYCGLIIFCHGLRKPPVENQPVMNGAECDGIWLKRGDYRTTSLALYGVIRIPLLASILRIADETDDSWTRALRNYWFEHQDSNTSNLGKAFRRCIEDIEFCHDGQCLVMHIPEMDDMEIDPSLKKRYIQSINKVRTDIQSVISNWGLELRKIGVQFNEVYFEYKNHLLTDFDPVSDSPAWPPLSAVVGTKNRKFVQEMFDAMIELSLGSCEYPQFTWETLEAQVGHPLTGVDRWLAKRIADASDNHIIINEQNEIRIEVKRGEVAEIRKLIYEEGVATDGK